MSNPITGGLHATTRGRLADPTFKWIVTGCGTTVLIILALMIGSTTLQAWPVLRKEGLDFLTGTTWQPGTARTEITGTYGALSFLYGTVLSSAIAIVIAVPLAIGIALYLTQLAPSRLRRPLTYAVDTLAVIPSVVYGLWGILFFVPVVLLPVMTLLANTVGKVVPMFAGPPLVRNVSVAGVVLAIMILPIISAITREIFATTPVDERFAAFGLGATRWEVIRHVVVPRGVSGVVGATMLGLGRAMGETIAVALTIGGSARIGLRLFQPYQSVAGHIASTFNEAAPEARAALVALGVALFGLTIIVNMAARMMVRRMGDITGDASV
jgi:phosphate transport system permease protein